MFRKTEIRPRPGEIYFYFFEKQLSGRKREGAHVRHRDEKRGF